MCDGLDPCPAEMLSVLIGRTLISHIAPYGGVASSYDVKSSNTTTNCLISNTFFFSSTICQHISLQSVTLASHLRFTQAP